MKLRNWGWVTDILVFLLGFTSLLSPFIFPKARNQAVLGAAFPIMVSLIIAFCLIIAIYEVQTAQLDSKIIAFLGVLIAINAGLRFLENAIPGPGGFSPIFFLILLTGYFFGSRLGFLMGAMTMLVSALITGGVGPWLPGQMITAGWVGQSAEFLKIIDMKIGLRNRPSEIFLLSLFGAVWGILFGAIMNLWFWPFLGAGFGQTFTQTAGMVENAQRYLAYYLATSLVWDITRAVGNVLLITIMARPVLKIFQRFFIKFSFQYNGETSV